MSRRLNTDGQLTTLSFYFDILPSFLYKCRHVPHTAVAGACMAAHSTTPYEIMSGSERLTNHLLRSMKTDSESNIYNLRSIEIYGHNFLRMLWLTHVKTGPPEPVPARSGKHLTNFVATGNAEEGIRPRHIIHKV